LSPNFKGNLTKKKAGKKRASFPSPQHTQAISLEDTETSEEKRKKSKLKALYRKHKAAILKMARDLNKADLEMKWSGSFEKTIEDDGKKKHLRDIIN